MTGKDILIVEDENIVALDMRMRLETMGYRVADVVDTGSLALERAQALSPDLVLMDIKLKGGQDGIEAARALRERAEVPVIFVTAFTDERTLERAKLTSPYGYIVKPFHERELKIAIELALYKHEYEITMQRSKELAEAANKLKGEFLANVSHELKTPLNSMIGFTELSMEKAVDGEQREYLAMSLAAARTLQTLIDSILDFTRMEAGRLAAVSAPFSLDSMLSDCVDALSMGAYSKGLDVSYRRCPDVPDSLIGDHFLLKQAILNLVDNAVKFTEAGRVGLGVRLAGDGAGDGERAVIEFSVSDTGLGMPPDKIESAFERFTQLDPTKTRKAGGTGLGLAIVKKAVELLEGEISIESAEGDGTIIRIRIPFGTMGDGTGRMSQLSGQRVAVAGFPDWEYEDVALALAGLGAEAYRADDIEAIAGAGGWALVEEGAALAATESAIGKLAPRLIIATRIGGAARRKLGTLKGCAFTPLPLRDYKIAAALGAIEGGPSAGARSERRRGEATADMAAGYGAPKADREGEGAAPVEPEAAGQQQALLERLAGVLEAASSQKSFAAAERESKSVKEAFAESGDRDGARIAFAALLLARKGDAEGLLDVATRARSASKDRKNGRRQDS